MSLSEPLPYCFEMRRRVEFVETDMAGIMHFSNFYRFMEATEHEFFRSMGHGVHETVDGETVGWPRVQSSCDFFNPVRFEDVVTIRLTIEEIRKRSVRYLYSFYLGSDDTETLVASGRMATVCVRLDGTAGTIASIGIPLTLRSKLEEAQGRQQT